MTEIKERAINFWVRYKRNKLAVIGLVILTFVSTVAALASFIAPNSPIQSAFGPSYSPPSREFLLGTDNLGRDIFSGLVYGTRIALLVGLLAASTAALIGTVVGIVSGYFGGIADDILMRITETMMVIPKLLFAIVLATLFGTTIWNIIFIIGILSWPTIARIVRAEVLSLKNRGFVEAARSIGSSDFNIMFTEILPNSLHVLTVSGSLQIASAILTEASLSFLGLSDPNILSWGRMLSIAQSSVFGGAWWMIIFPGVAILVTILAFNAVGDGLNEAMNPKLK